MRKLLGFCFLLSLCLLAVPAQAFNNPERHFDGAFVHPIVTPAEVEPNPAPVFAQGGGGTSGGFTKLANVSTSSYTDTTCANQTTCYYQVTTVDAQGFESVPASCAPAAICVGGNTAVAIMPSSGTHTVSITWTPPTLAVGVTVTYNVSRHSGPFGGSNLNTVIN